MPIQEAKKETIWGYVVDMAVNAELLSMMKLKRFCGVLPNRKVDKLKIVPSKILS